MPAPRRHPRGVSMPCMMRVNTAPGLTWAAKILTNAAKCSLVTSPLVRMVKTLGESHDGQLFWIHGHA